MVHEIVLIVQSVLDEIACIGERVKKYVLMLQHDPQLWAVFTYTLQSHKKKTFHSN